MAECNGYIVSRLSIHSIHFVDSPAKGTYPINWIPLVKSKIAEQETVGSSLTCWAYVSWCDMTQASNGKNCFSGYGMTWVGYTLMLIFEDFNHVEKSVVYVCNRSELPLPSNALSMHCNENSLLMG
jgi:hypothetical protein